MFERFNLSDIRQIDIDLDRRALDHPASLLKAGVISPDWVAVTGANGHLFIGDGANAWEGQYLHETPVPQAWIDGFTGLFARRREAAAARGVTLVNFVAPEKQVLLADQRWPDEVKPGAVRPLRQLLNAVGPAIVYPEAAMVASQALSPAYLRQDSHWTPSGCLAAAAPLLTALGVAADAAFPIPAERVMTAHDLPPHFFADPPRTEALKLQMAGVVSDDNRPFETTGRHTGTRYRVINAQAPDQRAVVIFGDSYAYDNGLTAVLSNVFRDVTFVWSKAVQWDLVDELEASVVVWQSAERFLATVPDQ